MSISKIDIGIVGGGASGLHLALALIKDDFFDQYKITLFEKSEKKQNDKTWSFWETNTGNWDDIISKKWQKGKIFAMNKEVDLQLAPFYYKTLKSIDFYKLAYQKINEAKNISVVFEEVKDLHENDNHVRIETTSTSYQADLVFNSRIPDINIIKKEAQFTLLQHFKGWFIESKTASFNPEEFVMMDYRHKDGNLTSFMYILPFSKNKALVEYTYFTPELVEKNKYDQFLKHYIKDNLNIEDFEITEEEYGIIPMTNYDFSKKQTTKIIQIGTAGGWVKASSGYSFKNAEKKAAQIVENLKQGIPANQGLFHPKYKHYDSIFLDVLYKDNQLGEEVFYKLYAKNKIQTLLLFLDEETNYLQDLSIIKSLSSWRFIKAFFNHLFAAK